MTPTANSPTPLPNTAGQRDSLALAVRRHLPGFAPTVIFDVGANVGQSAQAFAERFPQATIYAFEPVAAAYQALVVQTRALPAVRAFKTALGRGPGQVPMVVDPAKLVNSQVTIRPVRGAEHVENVPMDSGDRFCAANAIDRIGYLKVDTEGHDLEVLAGFAGMLSEKHIDLAEAEVSMNRANTKHVAFEAVKHYMETAGYFLFHIFEQTLDVGFSGRPIMRRANVVFISGSLAEKFRRR
jgi:FkbM family methyltransferase